MTLLFSMDLAGSIPLICYLFLFHIMGEKLPTKYYMFLLKMSTIFYLCPIQIFKYLLPERLLNIFSRLEITYPKSVDVVNHIDMQKISGNYLIYPSYIPIIYVICLSLFTLRTFLIWYQYFKSQKELLLKSDMLDENLYEFIEEHPQFSKLKKKSFYVLEQENINTPLTVGFYSSYIVLPNWCFEQTQKDFIYSHELTHILHHDVTWKALCTMAALLHWYNPFVYLLISHHVNACEYYADEYCTEYMSIQEKKDYISFIVQLAAISSDKEFIVPDFSNFLTGGKEAMKKRIDFIFKKNKTSKVKRTLSALCICLAFLMSSMTVLAYSPAVEDSIPLEDIHSDEEIEVTWTTGDAYPLSAISNLDFSETSSYFIDEDGNIIPLPLETGLEPYALCFHTYTNGYRQVHTKYSNGSCEVKTYNAQLCTKCGKCITGNLDHTTTWTKCPH